MRGTWGHRRARVYALLDIVEPRASKAPVELGASQGRRECLMITFPALQNRAQGRPD